MTQSSNATGAAIPVATPIAVRRGTLPRAWAACMLVGALGGALATLAVPAAAIAVTGPGVAAAAEHGRRAALTTPAPATTQTIATRTTPTLDLVRTRIDAVDLAAGTVTVRGQTLPLHAQQLRVLGPSGQVLGATGLRAGQQVRLALDPLQPAAGAAAAAAAPRRIVLIYVDG